MAYEARSRGEIGFGARTYPRGRVSLMLISSFRMPPGANAAGVIAVSALRVVISAVAGAAASFAPGGGGNLDVVPYDNPPLSADHAKEPTEVTVGRVKDHDCEGGRGSTPKPGGARSRTWGRRWGMLNDSGWSVISGAIGGACCALSVRGASGFLFCENDFGEWISGRGITDRFGSLPRVVAKSS